MLLMSEVPGWCAAVKISVTNKDAIDFFININSYYRKACGTHQASAIVVSVNEEEGAVIDVLKKLKFKKCHYVKNYLHNGRRTCLYIKQIPMQFIRKYL